MGIIKRKPRTPPWKYHPKWSTSQWWSFLRSRLRAAHTKWPPAHEAFAKAGRPYQGPNKRQKKEYLCDECKNWFPQAKMERDHIIPCGSLADFSDLPGFVERLFCSVDGYRILCTTCHKAKTKEERSKKD